MQRFVIKADVPVVNLQKTVSAMIAQAVDDYHELEQKGFIHHGQVEMEKVDRAKRSGHLYMAQQVQELIYFFKSSTLDEWLDTAQLSISPQRIRKELGIVC